MKRVYPQHEAQRLGTFFSKSVRESEDKIPLSAYIGAAAFLAVMAFIAFVGTAAGF